MPVGWKRAKGVAAASFFLDFGCLSLPRACGADIPRVPSTHPPHLVCAGIPMCLCNAETADACMDAYVKKAAKEPVDNDALNALFAAAGYNVG